MLCKTDLGTFYKNLSAPHLSLRCLSTFFVFTKKWLDEFTVRTIAIFAGVMDIIPIQACTTTSSFYIGPSQRESTPYTHPHEDKHAHALVDNENRRTHLATFTHSDHWPIFHMLFFISIISNRAIVLPALPFLWYPIFQTNRCRELAY